MLEKIGMFILGFTIATLIAMISKRRKKDYSKLIKRCIEEANANISNDGKKKHSN